MPIKLYDTKDAVPEAQRTTALETKDGKFAVEEVDPALGDAGKKALDEERDRAATAERTAKAEKKRADDLQRTIDARAKGISEEELQKIRDAEALARKPIEDERDTLAAENRKLKLTDRVQALYLANGGMPDRVEDAMLALEKRTDLGDKGGIVFKDKDGKVTADDPAAFFKNFKTEKPWLFQGTGASGSGTGGSGGGGDDSPKTKQETIDAKRRQVSAAF